MSAHPRLAAECLAALGAFVATALAGGQAAPAPDLDCLNNQKLLVETLRAHALENRVLPGHTVLLENLAVYFKDQELPVCPLGGRYPIVLTVTGDPLDVETTPICSLGSAEQHRQRASGQREPAVLERARWLAVLVAVVALSPFLLARRHRRARAVAPPEAEDG